MEVGMFRISGQGLQLVLPALGLVICFYRVEGL